MTIRAEEVRTVVDVLRGVSDDVDPEKLARQILGALDKLGAPQSPRYWVVARAYKIADAPDPEYSTGFQGMGTFMSMDTAMKRAADVGGVFIPVYDWYHRDRPPEVVGRKAREAGQLAS